MNNMVRRVLSALWTCTQGLILLALIAVIGIVAVWVIGGTPDRTGDLQPATDNPTTRG